MLEQLEYFEKSGNPRAVDDAVLDVLRFARTGIAFGLPKYLRVLSAIQKDVLGRHGLRSGDFSQFAAAAESSFRPPALAALDEYGVPLEIADRLGNRVLPKADSSLDEVLERLKSLDVVNVARSSFELHLLQDAQQGL